MCESLGHEVVEAAPSIDYDALLAAFTLIFEGHSAARLDRIGHVRGKRVTPDEVEPMTWRWAEAGWNASAAQLAGSSRQSTSRPGRWPSSSQSTT